MRLAANECIGCRWFWQVYSAICEIGNMPVRTDVGHKSHIKLCDDFELITFETFMVRGTHCARCGKKVYEPEHIRGYPVCLKCATTWKAFISKYPTR